MAKLSDRLRHLMAEEDLITDAPFSKALPTLCLAKLFMQQHPSERAFEESFRCFTELLSRR
jgi:hypothetical protein